MSAIRDFSAMDLAVSGSGLFRFFQLDVTSDEVASQKWHTEHEHTYKEDYQPMKRAKLSHVFSPARTPKSDAESSQSQTLTGRQ
jgi:hypothetical protein